MAKNILLLNGPNLNLLGTREPHIYGSANIQDIESAAKAQASSLHINLETFQSNHEGELIDRIHQAREEKVDEIIINPAAFTHTSVALRDALAGVAIPFVEIHITNVHRREAFRHHSYLSEKAEAVIMGMGVFGYRCAIDYAAKKMVEDMMAPYYLLGTFIETTSDQSACSAVCYTRSLLLGVPASTALAMATLQYADPNHRLRLREEDSIPQFRCRVAG